MNLRPASPRLSGHVIRAKVHLVRTILWNCCSSQANTAFRKAPEDVPFLNKMENATSGADSSCRSRCILFATNQGKAALEKRRSTVLIRTLIRNTHAVENPSQALPELLQNGESLEKILCRPVALFRNHLTIRHFGIRLSTLRASWKLGYL